MKMIYQLSRGQYFIRFCILLIQYCVLEYGLPLLNHLLIVGDGSATYSFALK